MSSKWNSLALFLAVAVGISSALGVLTLPGEWYAALIVVFIVLARRVDVRASWLFLPYAAWVGFASGLNISIGLLN